MDDGPVAHHRRRHHRRLHHTRVEREPPHGDEPHGDAPSQLEHDIRNGGIDTVLVVFPDHQGRLVGKRTDGHFYLDEVAHHGTENCDYLIACDIDNEPLRRASASPATTRATATCAAWSTASTIRYLPWIARTRRWCCATWSTSTPARPSPCRPARSCATRWPRPTAAGLPCPMIGSEIEFYLFKDDFDSAAGAQLPGHHPNGLYYEDYHILQTTKEEDIDRRHPARPRRRRAARRVLQGRGRPRPARAQPHVLRGGRDGRRQRRLQERGEGDRRPARQVGHVHGQVRLRRDRLVGPHPLVAVGRPTGHAAR